MSATRTKTPPLPLLIETDENGQKLLCPVCKYEYVHLEGSTLMLAGKDSYKARPQICRGGVILIPGWCEHGHRFAIGLGFHKGYTFVWTELRKDAKNDSQLKDMR